MYLSSGSSKEHIHRLALAFAACHVHWFMKWAELILCYLHVTLNSANHQWHYIGCSWTGLKFTSYKGLGFKNWVATYLGNSCWLCLTYVLCIHLIYVFTPFPLMFRAEFGRTFLTKIWPVMLWLFVRPTGVCLLDLFCSGIQFYLLLSPYLCFISFLYLDLYVLWDDAMIS